MEKQEKTASRRKEEHAALPTSQHHIYQIRPSFLSPVVHAGIGRKAGQFRYLRANLSAWYTD
jgi:hypothetical protein